MNSKERERERTRAREGDKDPVGAVHTSKLQSAPFASTSAVNRDPRSRIRLCVDRDRRSASRDRAIDRDLAFAQIAIDASQDRAVDCDLAFVPIAIDTVRDRAVDRDLAKRRGASLDHEVVGLEFAKHRVVERRRS